MRMRVRHAKGPFAWRLFAVAVVVLIGLYGLAPAFGAAGDFPNRPVVLIVGFAAGGGTDLTARLFASVAQKYLGQPIEVQNIVGGANGSLGAAKVAVSRPDGYTVLLGSSDGITVEPNRTKLPYSYKSFTALARIDRVTYVLAAGPKSPVKTADELMSYARQNPNKLTVGVSGIGGAPHLAMANIFLALGALKLKYIPFEGAGPALTALLGGSLDLMIGSVQGVLATARAGKLSPVFVGSVDPVDAMPDVPGAKALGVPAASMTGWRTLLSPARTPSDIIERLNGVFAKALADPDYKTRLLAAGGEWDPSTDMAALNAQIEAENRSIVTVLRTVFGISR